MSRYRALCKCLPSVYPCPNNIYMTFLISWNAHLRSYGIRDSDNQAASAIFSRLISCIALFCVSSSIPPFHNFFVSFAASIARMRSYNTDILSRRSSRRLRCPRNVKYRWEIEHNRTPIHPRLMTETLVKAREGKWGNVHVERDGGDGDCKERW